MTSEPYVVKRPEDTKPRLMWLREMFWEFVGNERRAATLRWRERNASQPRECPCGAAGTVRVGDTSGAIGSAQPYWWRCDEHAVVSLETPWMGNRPMRLISREGNTTTWGEA